MTGRGLANSRPAWLVYLCGHGPLTIGEPEPRGAVTETGGAMSRFLAALLTVLATTLPSWAYMGSYTVPWK